MVDLLRGERQLTTAELALQLGISERTLRRDFLRLQELGIDVETRPGRSGGVTLRGGSLLPALRFTDDEALALALGLNYAENLPQPELSRAARTAFKRLEHVLTEQLREKVEALRTSLPSPSSATETADKLPSQSLFTLAEAIKVQRRLKVRYRAASGGVTYRTFDPYGLAQVLGHWYVVGHCHLRTDQRVFRVDRLDVLEEPHFPSASGQFTLPPHLDAVQVISQSIARTPTTSGLVCQVWAQITPQAARDSLPAYRAMVTPDQQGVMLTLNTEPQWLEALAISLLDLGCPVQVISPPALQEAFKHLSQRTLNISQGVCT